MLLTFFATATALVLVLDNLGQPQAVELPECEKNATPSQPEKADEPLKPEKPTDSTRIKRAPDPAWAGQLLVGVTPLRKSLKDKTASRVADAALNENTQSIKAGWQNSGKLIWQEKLVLIASALPIALLANLIRIVATAMVAELIDIQAASLVFHDLAGWLMMPLALGMLALELWLLKKLYVEVPKRMADDHYMGHLVSPPGVMSKTAPRQAKELAAKTN
jgi:exosortase/archaeosortase family protein